MPLLFEAGHESAFDATIAVVADDGIRARSAPLPAATRRSTSAPPASSAQHEKAQRATYVVHNSGTLEELEQELSSVLAKLTS